MAEGDFNRAPGHSIPAADQPYSAETINGRHFASGSTRISGGLIPLGPIRERGSIGLTLSGFTPSQARRAGPVEPFLRFTE